MRHFYDSFVELNLDGNRLDSTTIDALKKEEKSIVLSKNGYEWNASVQFDSTSQCPTLCVYDENVPFDDLVLAPKSGQILYRRCRKNVFKGRIKQTEFELAWGDQQQLMIQCQYDDRNQVTALIAGKRKEVRKGKKLKDLS